MEKGDRKTITSVSTAAAANAAHDKSLDPVTQSQNGLSHKVSADQFALASSWTKQLEHCHGTRTVSYTGGFKGDAAQRSLSSAVRSPLGAQLSRRIDQAAEGVLAFARPQTAAPLFARRPAERAPSTPVRLPPLLPEILRHHVSRLYNITYFQYEVIHHIWGLWKTKKLLLKK